MLCVSYFLQKHLLKNKSLNTCSSLPLLHGRKCELCVTIRAFKISISSQLPLRRSHSGIFSKSNCPQGRPLIIGAAIFHHIILLNNYFCGTPIECCFCVLKSWRKFQGNIWNNQTNSKFQFVGNPCRMSNFLKKQRNKEGNACLIPCSQEQK